MKKMPPYDSWISLSAGQRVTLHAESMKEWHEKTRKYQQIRGIILAEAFQIEFAMDRLVCTIFFPGFAKATATSEMTNAVIGLTVQESSGLFDERYLKSGSSLSKKIQNLKFILSNISALSTKIPPPFFQQLEKIRDVRNRFAHYPIAFEPAEGKDEAFSAQIVCRDKEILLNEKFFEDFDNTVRSINQVFEDLSSLVAGTNAATEHPE